MQELFGVYCTVGGLDGWSRCCGTQPMVSERTVLVTRESVVVKFPCNYYTADRPELETNLARRAHILKPQLESIKESILHFFWSRNFCHTGAIMRTSGSIDHLAIVIHLGQNISMWCIVPLL